GPVDDGVSVQDPREVRRRNRREALPDARERDEQHRSVQDGHEDRETRPRQRPPGARRNDLVRPDDLERLLARAHDAAPGLAVAASMNTSICWPTYSGRSCRSIR